MASFNLFRRLLGESDRREASRVQAPGGTRILVVDDSSTIRAVLAKMLIQDGYAVLKAADGESALEVARDEQPDLIFLDIVLPRMNGFAVLRALRRDERTRNIPIVMISGNLQATEQFYVQRFGADDFMKKPFGRAEVFSRIQALVEADRLPRREAGSETQAAAMELEGMDHIPDIALPDEDLDEARPVTSDTADEAPLASSSGHTDEARPAATEDTDNQASSDNGAAKAAKEIPPAAEPVEKLTEPAAPVEAAVQQTESREAAAQDVAHPPAPAAVSPSDESPQTSLWHDIDEEASKES